MHDEGYIKFNPEWEMAPPMPEAALQELLAWRARLYELGLIGAYDNGIGFGNISHRWGSGEQFVISGSATGLIPRLGPEHFTLVSRVDIDANRLWCQGPVIASSESMSHAVIYRECPEVRGVIHVHSLPLWEKLLHQVPTTDQRATYGSPEMALSIIHLLQTTPLREQGIFVMEGHREGIFTFGSTLDEAGAVLLGYL